MLLLPVLAFAASDSADMAEQNKKLQDQLREQQRMLDELRSEMGKLSKSNERLSEDVRMLKGESHESDPAPRRSTGSVIVSGEVGLGFFDSESAGQFPNAEFRVDEAKLFVEAVVWEDVYAFFGVDVVTRESYDEYLHVGELYVDFENVLARWSKDSQVTFRAGRFNIPFGEEYQVRGVITNPLISHSLSDIWGIDEGIELYGSIGPVQYVVAVQNGGHPTLHDYDSDKSYTARIGYDPTHWLHLSVSGMRTGDLRVQGDQLSEVWFGNGFFRALGSPATTTVFSVNLGEMDATAHWKGGQVKAAWGQAKFDDNDRTADNSRRLHYYFIEGKQKLVGKLYAAARYSRIEVTKGYPIVGQGNFGTYFFGGTMCDKMWRLGLGLGYQFGAPLIVKAEYSMEEGHTTTGAERDQQDLLASEIVLKF